MDSYNKYLTHLRSDKHLRNAVGWIGILLPIILMHGEFIIYGGDYILDSISGYYHTGMRDVFVGALCAVALYLFFYTGYDKWDNWAGNLAGFLALGVAWFPTTKEGPIDTIGIVHLIFAILFFLTLAGFSYFLFTKEGDTPKQRKIIRKRIYKVCAYVMVGCLAAILIYILFIQDNNSNSSFIFWAETFALIAFGVSWLTKGRTIYSDK